MYKETPEEWEKQMDKETIITRKRNHDRKTGWGV